MTPNNEVKAKLFGLYYGQKIYKNHRYIDDVTELTTSHIEQILYGNYVTAHYLLLRSIEQLKDEEVKTCARLLWDKWGYTSTLDIDSDTTVDDLQENICNEPAGIIAEIQNICGEYLDRLTTHYEQTGNTRMLKRCQKIIEKYQ